MVQFHLISFEGPDRYARAGGIASRVTGLARALEQMGFQTHLWFVGDPGLPGYEIDGNLHVHRWCQWLSAHHSAGVYDGEWAKERDFAASLPPAALAVLEPHLQTGGHAVVLAEEWHTAHAVQHLGWLLEQRGLRERVRVFWNANNTFGFDFIDWGKLARASAITTVSRYMKHRMAQLGVDALVIPNGIEDDAFESPGMLAVSELRRRFIRRELLVKIARWDPDKRWLLAMDTLAELKRQGGRPLLVARGGMEAHGLEVMAHSRALGLKIEERHQNTAGPRGLLGALDGVNGADIILLNTHVDPAARRTLFRAADAVLANSGHEPFGLVGLETMAAGGVACTGCSGEDYAVHGKNALVLQTDDPSEFVSRFKQLQKSPGAQSNMRATAQRTAQDYAWPAVLRLGLFPWLGEEVLTQMGDEGKRTLQADGAFDRLGAALAAVEQRVWCSVSALRASLRLPRRDTLEA